MTEEKKLKDKAKNKDNNEGKNDVSHSARVEEEIRKMIITAELAPGSNVTQSYLIEKLNCGRTPLREAIQRLIATKEVVLVPNKGIYIPSVDVFDLTSSMEALRVVAPKIAELASLRATEEDLEKINELLIKYEDEYHKDKKSPELGNLDYKFHKLIAKAAKNDFLYELVARASTSYLRFGYMSRKLNLDDAVLLQVLDEHRELFSAIKEKDVEKAVRINETHFANKRVQLLGRAL